MKNGKTGNGIFHVTDFSLPALNKVLCESKGVECVEGGVPEKRGGGERRQLLETSPGSGEKAAYFAGRESLGRKREKSAGKDPKDSSLL